MYNRTFARAPRRGTSALFFASIAALALSTSASVATPAPTSWDAASEFTDGGNPNFGGGAWSYCEEATLNASCTLLSVPYNNNSANILGWTNANSYPVVAHNVNQVPFVATGAGGSVTFAAHGLFLHPGASCEYAVARFTAPTPGTYKVSGQFFGMDDNGSRTTTDVHISVNGGPATIYDGNVSLNVASMHYASFTVHGGIILAAGGTIDFQVGCGGDGYGYDSTGLNAVIESKPRKK